MKSPAIKKKSELKKIISAVGPEEVTRYLNEVAEWLVEDQTFTYTYMKGTEIPRYKWLLEKTNDYLKRGGKGEFAFIDELSDPTEKQEIADLLGVIGIKRLNSLIKKIAKSNERLNLYDECRRICGDCSLVELEKLLTDLEGYKKAKADGFRMTKARSKKTQKLINRLQKDFKLPEIIGEVTRIKREVIAAEINDIIFEQESSRTEFVDLESFARVEGAFIALTQSQAQEK